MKRSPTINGLALLPGILLACGLSSGLWAATSALDVLPGERAGEAADSVELGTVKPIGTPPSREAAKPVPRGNPLWSVPLSALTVTQERPIFSASRRPPPRAVVAPAAEEASLSPPPRPAEPERPPLALIGAVVGEGDSIAVFVDRTSQKMIRLRPGEAHAGWVLNAVARREVTLRKANRSETIELKAADAPVQAGAPALPAAALLPLAPRMPGQLDPSYAPFTPRATPKNGESDGL
jgi:general secretion pathway protein N